MWKFKLLLVPTIVLGTLLFGVVSAHAWGWWWNAELEVGGEEVHTVWAVDGNEADYFASINIYLPQGVTAEVVEASDNERVRLHEDGDLACGPGGAETRVEYKVRAKGKANDTVVTARVTGAGNNDLGEPAIGSTHGKITVNAVIPGACGR